MKKIILALACAVSVKASAASGGFDHGNGGDICENRFNLIRYELKEWILQGGSEGLILPSGLSFEKYNQGMLSQLQVAKVSCTQDKIYIGNAEKTCKNYTAASGDAFVVCNVDRFMNTPVEDKYVLVHHEFAGLAGFEKNREEISDYGISNQITGYVESVVVKKLVVKPGKAKSHDDNYCARGDDIPFPWGF